MIDNVACDGGLCPQYCASATCHDCDGGCVMATEHSTEVLCLTSAHNCDSTETSFNNATSSFNKSTPLFNNPTPPPLPIKFIAIAIGAAALCSIALTAVFIITQKSKMKSRKTEYNYIVLNEKKIII